MIRNVVLGRLRQAEDPAQREADAAQLQQGLAAIAALSFPGLVAMSAGTDLGLRDGGWSFAIVNDWQDADAYRAYDADQEHNRIRREIIVPICQDIARVQFELDRHGEQGLSHRSRSTVQAGSVLGPHSSSEPNATE